MKYIIYILIFICLGLSVKAQVPTGFPSQRWAGWIEPTYVVPDSGTIITKRDTSFIPRFVGTTVTWQRPGIDTTFWFWNGAHWGRVTFAQLDTTSLSNRINLKLNISDTTGKWLSQTSRLVDTVYRVNDSTVGYTIKGQARSFQILGRLPSGGTGTVTSVALSMPAAFTVSGSPITTSGTFNVSGAGTSAQYIKGNGTLGTFDTSAIPDFYLKVRGLLSGTSPITYNPTTGIIGILNANSTGQKGAATFNNSDFTDNGSALISLAPIGSGGSCLNCQLTIDTKGRITSFADGSIFLLSNAPGAGDTLVVSGDTIKRIYASYGLISTPTASSIALRVDTTLIQKLITANNGLTKTGNNIQLGGSLIQATNITSAAGANRIIYSGVSSFGDGAQLDVSTTGSAGIGVRGQAIDGRGIFGVATTGVGVYGTATGTGGYGLFGLSTLGNAIYGRADSGIIWEGEMVPHSNNTIIPARSTTRSSQSFGANGIGYSDDSYLQTSIGGNQLTNRIIYKLTNATDASYTSSFEFWNANNATLARKMAIAGNGQITLDQYTGTNFQTIDTSFNSLVVDGLGNIFKRSGDVGGQNIQQTLTVGDTSLRAVIFKDTSSVLLNTLITQKIIPFNNGIIYTHGHGGLFNTNIAKYSGVNPDGRPNVVGNLWEYNSIAAQRIDTNEAAFRFGTETHFQIGSGQDPAFEFHLPEVVTQSGTYFRPFSMYIIKSSGLTNTNMQITQLSLKNQLNANIDWLTFLNNGGALISHFADSNNRSFDYFFQLPSYSGTMSYKSTGFSFTGDGGFNVDMPISYGSATHLTGMDGYGDRTSRESNSIVYNTGSSATFADWQYNSVQKYNFRQDLANFSVPIYMSGQNILMLSNGTIASSGSDLRFASSSGAGSDIIFFNGADAARAMTLFKAGSGQPMNVNIGPSTISPSHQFEVQGSTVIDSNIYVKMHDIASNSDSAVVWNRTTNKYNIAKINGAPVTTLYTGDGTANNRTVTVTGSTMTFTSALTSPTPTLTVNNTSSGHGVLGSASGAGYGIYGSGFRGVYGTGTGGGTGVYGQETSGTGMHSFVTTGTSLQIDHVPTSFNDIQTAVLVNRTTSGNSGNGANGIGTSIQFAAPTTTTTNASVGGALNWYWATATNASRKGAFSLQTVTNAGSLTDKLIVSDDIQLNANSYIFKKIDNTVPYTAVILGPDNSFELGYTPVPTVFNKGSGILIDTNNNASLGATQIPSTAPLYTTGGSTYVSGFQNQAGNFLRVDNITTNITATLTQNFFVIDATSGSITITLPSASAAFAGAIGIDYTFKRIDNTGNTVTISRAGSDLIDGATTTTLTSQYQSKSLRATSTTAWSIY